jgi:glycine/D-amino acid oxidase-like deaminating enzyme/nitrite reductase/ring-hydroxylating ferredoxin subunit
MNAVEQATRSCWHSDAKSYRASLLRKNAICDVCIVGGGLAGMSVAYRLAKAGASVAVLDAQRIGDGETGRTSAHLVTALDRRYGDLRSCHGAESTRLIAESHRAAIDTIERIAAEEQIECDFRRCNGYLVGTSTDGDRVVRQEDEAARDAGLATQLLERPPFAALGGAACVRFDLQGAFHPLKYLNGLASAVRKMGGTLHHNTRAKEIQGGKDAHVKVESGRMISCRHVVVATNTPVNDWTTMHTSLAPYRSYVVGLELDDKDAFDDLYWDTEEPFHYVRCHGIGAGGGKPILLVGGEDHKTGQAGDALDEDDDRFDRLESWARERFSEAGKRRFAWSGQVFETADGIAYIGANPHDEPNVYISTGDCGNGMTHSVIAGEILSALVQGHDHPWAKTYAPDRVRPAATWRYLKENANVAAQYADWVTGGDVAKVEDISLDAGAIVRQGMSKIAVYRDAGGELHRMSATCPHLGCVVAWNNIEKSWDCPCHGSRFSARGEVICGPALVRLGAADKPEGESAPSQTRDQ